MCSKALFCSCKKVLHCASHGIMADNKLRLFCSNMDLSNHPHILHTGVFEGEEFNEKSFICRKLTVLEIFEKINEFP